jgi:hypothetical protein
MGSNPSIKVSGWQDSNLRPPAPKAGAIPGYATPRKINQALKTSELHGDKAKRVRSFLPLQVLKNAEGGKGPSAPVIRLIGTKVRQRGCPGNLHGAIYLPYGLNNP